jgi:predicted dehydrogenase
MVGAELRCMMDEDPDRAKSAADDAEVSVEYELDDVLRRPDVGLVIVSVPNAAHEGIVRAALDAGRHVICEKPLAPEVAAAQRMVAAAEARGRFLKVGANHRYIPAVHSALDVVQRGAIGPPLAFRGWIGHDGSRFGSPWFTQRARAGGGTLLDNGVHLLDLARCAMGEVTHCVARTANLAHPSWDVEDYATALYDTASGGIITVTSSWIDRSGYFYFEIHGEKGFVSVDSDRGMAAGPAALGISADVEPGQPGESYRRELEDAISSIHVGRAPVPTGHDGEAVVRMVQAAYESSRTGQQISL